MSPINLMSITENMHNSINLHPSNVNYKLITKPLISEELKQSV